jgi:hypothetical protein
VQQQDREQRTLLLPAQLDREITNTDLKRTQNSIVQAPSLRFSQQGYHRFADALQPPQFTVTGDHSQPSSEPELSMSRQNAEAARVRFPHHVRPDRTAIEHELVLLNNWRSGSAATAMVVGGLLPFAVAWHVTYLIAIAASMIGAVSLALGCHLTREHRLSTLVIFPEFAQLPDLAGKRKRLQSTRNRRALADGLRRTAAPNQPSRRFDCCPVLPDRIAGVRSELLELASALEQTPDPDPACVALIRELLTDGCSPLYNPNVPDDDLHTTLTRARGGMAANPPPDALPR